MAHKFHGTWVLLFCLYGMYAVGGTGSSKPATYPGTLPTTPEQTQRAATLLQEELDTTANKMAALASPAAAGDVKGARAAAAEAVVDRLVAAEVKRLSASDAESAAAALIPIPASPPSPASPTASADALAMYTPTDTRWRITKALGLRAAPQAVPVSPEPPKPSSLALAADAARHTAEAAAKMDSALGRVNTLQPQLQALSDTAVPALNDAAGKVERAAPHFATTAAYADSFMDKLTHILKSTSIHVQIGGTALMWYGAKLMYSGGMLYTSVKGKGQKERLECREQGLNRMKLGAKMFVGGVALHLGARYCRAKNRARKDKLKAVRDSVPDAIPRSDSV